MDKHSNLCLVDSHPPALPPLATVDQLAAQARVISSNLSLLQSVTTQGLDDGELSPEKLDALHVVLGDIHQKAETLANAIQEIQSRQ